LHPAHIIKPAKPDLCHNFTGQPTRAATDEERVGENIRGTHLHTQHPIELANLLNGVGLSKDGRTASEDRDAWEAGLPLWVSYLEWLIANKQNFVEWALLEWGDHSGFSTSKERQKRIKLLVEMAHDWGIRVSIDAPLNLQQQHAWRLQIQSRLVKKDVEERVKWLLGTGIDELSTEVGSTEFSSTDPKMTVEILDSLVDLLARQGKHVMVKNHVSTSQVAAGFKDPLDPSKNINFNYLSYYADERIISAPHTVQMYSLTCPLVGSYGRTNYTDIDRMMSLFEKKKKPQVFFPETAYWVNFDITVPISLPLYAQNRLFDVQLLARTTAPHAGHLNFESGWAFGYWINNAAQARATWTRGRHDDGAEYSAQTLFQEVLAPLGKRGRRLASILSNLTDFQNKYLVYEKFPDPNDPSKEQTLMGYLEGWDGMAEAQAHFQFAVVQPDRVHPRDISNHRQWFADYLAPQLKHLEMLTLTSAKSCKSLREEALAAKDPGYRLLLDACVGVELFFWRVRQVRAIYSAAFNNDFTVRELARSESSIQHGLALIKMLDLPPEWSEWNGQAWPTAYPYGHLWPAASLFFWRRDHQIVQHSIVKPCYLNLYDPVEIGLPFSSWKAWYKQPAGWLGGFLSWAPWFSQWAECCSGPSADGPLLDAINLPSSFEMPEPEPEAIGDVEMTS